MSEEKIIGKDGVEYTPMEKEEKNKGGRPTKLTPKFLEVFKEVVEEAMGIDTTEVMNKFNAIFLTDEELISNINDKLIEKKQDTISITRFKAWKSGDLDNKDEVLDKFRAIYKKALQIQRKALLFDMYREEKGWQRFAWIIERKFKDWRMKHQFDHTTNDKDINGTINYFNDEELLKQARETYERDKNRDKEI